VIDATLRDVTFDTVAVYNVAARRAECGRLVQHGTAMVPERTPRRPS
jgi:hypothetical protein